MAKVIQVIGCIGAWFLKNANMIVGVITALVKLIAGILSLAGAEDKRIDKVEKIGKKVQKVIFKTQKVLVSLKK